MSESNGVVRTVEAGELQAFHRFLERSYGSAYGAFLTNYPDLYRNDQKALSCNLVVEDEGSIVGHVGLFPLEVVAGEARLRMAGIGGVATDPEQRGKGHMSRLLSAALDRMRSDGVHLAVLWGDRQRYGHFGYEIAGERWYMTLTRRSLTAAGAEPAAVEEIDPKDEGAVRVVRTWHDSLSYRLERSNWALQLRRPRIRLFTGPDGYVLTRRDNGRNLNVVEFAAKKGKAADLILGALGRTFGEQASVDAVRGDEERLEELVPYASRWASSPQGMFRVVDWPGTVRALEHVLAERAIDLAPFEGSIGCDTGNGLQVVTFRWDGKSLKIESGKAGAGVIELDPRRLVRLLLGGPGAGTGGLGPLGRLFPVPVHIPMLDHV